jgi:hypothetical protein
MSEIDIIDGLRNWMVLTDPTMRAEVCNNAADEIERLRASLDDECHKNEALLREVGCLRTWVIATARSVAQSGLSLEEYNKITQDVLRKLAEGGG